MANLRKLTVRAALAFACLACAPAGALAAGPVDQEQRDFSGTELGISSVSSWSQTFTAGRTGTLDQVELAFTKTDSPAAPLTVEIRDVSGGLPGSTVLASSSVPASAVNTIVGIPMTQIPVSVPVVAGTQYAIVAHSVPNPGGMYFVDSALGAYPGGQAFGASTSTGNGPWIDFGSSLDLTFATYVTGTETGSGSTGTGSGTAVAPALAATGRRAAAVKRCKKKFPKGSKQRKRCLRRAQRLPQ